MLTRLWMYVVLKSLATKMNKICQENMFIKYPTITKTKEDVPLKDNIQMESLLGDTVQTVATFQRNGIKENQTMQTVLPVAIIISGSPARQKRSNPTIVKRPDISKNLQNEGFEGRRTCSQNCCWTNSFNKSTDCKGSDKE